MCKLKPKWDTIAHPPEWLWLRRQMLPSDGKNLGGKLSYIVSGNITVLESLLKTVGQFHKKWNIDFSFRPAIPLLILSLNSLRSTKAFISAQRSTHLLSSTTTSGSRYLCWLILSLNYFSTKGAGIIRYPNAKQKDLLHMTPKAQSIIKK